MRAWYPQAEIWQAYAWTFTNLETPITAIVFGLVVLVALVARGSFGEVAGFVVACCVVPVNVLLKITLGPSPLWAQHVHNANDYPSGHVSFVVAVIGYLGWVGWRHGRRWVAALAALLAVLVGPARVVTGIHILSDVVGGYVLGASLLILAVTCARSLEAAPESGPLRAPRPSADVG